MTAATGILGAGLTDGRTVRPAQDGTAPRWIAAVVSALLHVAVVVVALFDLGLFDAFAPVMEEAIPVEIIMVPAAELEPEPAPPPEPEPEPEPQLEEEVPVEVPPEPVPEVTSGGEKVEAEEIEEVTPEEESEPQAEEEASAEPAEEVVEKEPPQEAEAAEAVEIPPEPEAEVAALPRARSALRPQARPKEVPPPARKTAAAPQYIGEWVLDPLRVDYGHRCGSAKLTGRLRLTRAEGPNRFQGELRTSIFWARCPPEGARYQVLLSIRGNQALMTGSGGFVDRGVIGDGVMRLKDQYGTSVWRKR